MSKLNIKPNRVKCTECGELECLDYFMLIKLSFPLTSVEKIYCCDLTYGSPELTTNCGLMACLDFSLQHVCCVPTWWHLLFIFS